MKLRTNEPFWLVKNGIIDSYPSLQDDIEADIVIVGAGITGSLMAHQCLTDGYKTVLIDRREIGNGSTSATTSMLQYEIDTPLYRLIEMIGKEGAIANYQACFDSIDRLGEISKEINSACGFEKKESLYFAAFKKDVSNLQKEFEARKENGFPVKWLSASAIEKKFGVTNSWGGILSEQGGSIDAFRLAHDLLAYNSKKGLKVYDKTNIKKTNHTKKGVTLTTDTGYTAKAKTVIYCTGFESVTLIKDKFVDLLSTYAMVGERSGDNQKRLNSTLFWNTTDPYMYMRTTDDNRLLIGGEDEEFVDAEKRDGLISEKVKKLEKYLKKILPDYEFVPDFAWAGTFGETKDGLPYIGKHPEFDNTYFVLGFGGNGITFSVIGMELISQLLRGHSHPLSAYYRFRR
ncbi:FAD-dependent oxidoreductase [uncultured Kriegella sp.]|uniref:NAD(P)/FAD-dependent oxidoreductase n=1 Tax=uncultured Kriegella sp. TaxID=1798910 RepID=UPI0030D83439|tara:strand:+ start:11832 stop:13037 length:1206 start_codon:yes stop_codon:yes gene_type:complete